MATAKLSSLSFQTLSSLLERQRLQTLGKTAPSAQLTTIKRNMGVLRSGILELEQESVGSSSSYEASELVKSAEQLRSQWQRARKMLLEEGVEIDDIPDYQPPEPAPQDKSPSSSELPKPSNPSPFDTPYRDEPSRASTPPFDSGEEMQTQRHMMDEQDTRLESLSGSIRRQRELSENIGEELDVHTGLLEDLESGIDNTALRLGGARRRLETFSRGARDNWSTLTIAGLIVILLILIILFKT
ncbi:hypothetical protein DL93DRAFT_2076770 [Clavulina sp. PMI_390]|nr:hypothetical protein DL93DRAFT_2076770 [Clavulina sp. PMI_390]